MMLVLVLSLDSMRNEVHGLSVVKQGMTQSMEFSMFNVPIVHCVSLGLWTGAGQLPWGEGCSWVRALEEGEPSR